MSTLEDADELCQRAQALLSPFSPPRPNNDEQEQDVAVEPPMELFQKALTIRQSISGEDHETVASTHCEIAKAWITQRYYALALEHYALALAILKDNKVKISALEQDMTKLLDITVETANCSMQHGMEAQARQQQSSDALQHFEYAHSLLSAVLKHSSSQKTLEEETKLNTLALTDVCRVIASVHVSHSDYFQALPFLQQAQALLEALLGADDPRTLAMTNDVKTLEKLARRPDVDDVVHWFEQEDYNEEREELKEVVQDDDKPLGVSIDWIKRGFWQQIQAANLDPSATIQQVMDEVLATKHPQPYIHQLEQQHTGPASLMLSYANESTLADIINTLDDYCRTQSLDDRTIFVWMECLCQSELSMLPPSEKKEPEQEEKLQTTDDSNDEHVQELQDRISKIGHVLAILTPWYSPLAWKQACLQEISLAKRTPGCQLTLVLPPADTAAVSDALVGDPSLQIAQLYQALSQLQVDQQRIFRPWIRNVIQAQVKEHCTNDDTGNASNRSLQSTMSTTEEAMEVFRLQLCNKMGLLFWQYGEYKTSLELLEDALSMTETLYGELHESTATVYQNIANVLSDMGRYPMALDTYLKALQIMQSANPPPTLRIAGLCTKLGNLYRMTDQLNKAMEYHQRALTIHAKPNTNNLAAAECYKDMGHVFFSKGDNDAALMEFRKALGIQQKILGAAGAHPTIAVTHNHIGLVFKTKGNYQAALKEYQTALAIQQEALGKDHVQTAMSLDNIASVLECQDDWEGALDIGRQAQQIYETSLGPNHPTTAAAWHAMGVIQNELDQVEDALTSYHKALEIRQTVLGMEHPSTAETLQSIGTLLFEIGDLDEALVELRKAFDIVEPLLGIEHPTTKGLADAINAVLEA